MRRRIKIPAAYIGIGTPDTTVTITSMKDVTRPHCQRVEWSDAEIGYVWKGFSQQVPEWKGGIGPYGRGKWHGDTRQRVIQQLIANQISIDAREKEESDET